MTKNAAPAAYKIYSSRMENILGFFFIALAGLFIGTHGFSDFGDARIDLQKYLKWNYTQVNVNCTSASTSTPCKDVRICDFATASLAMGGWPTLCGWVGKEVPKVCCGLPLVLGKKLIEKVDEEKARKRRCGTASFEQNISETEAKFFEIMRSLPPVDTSDPNKFDPPLDITEPVVSSVGAVPSSQGHFPWMVSILKAGKQWCGGTLIDRSHILSAAHCFVYNRRKPDPNDYIVYVGNTYAGEGYPYHVTKIAIHPDYHPPYYYHDLAILTLSAEILTPFIGHICLPSPEMSATDLTGKNTTLLGWGPKTFGESKKSILHIVEDLLVVPLRECKTHYRRIEADSLPAGLTEDFMCARLEEGDKDACQMDSGGPLMYRNNYENLFDGHPDIPWVQVGVVSLRFSSCEPGFPGVYTKVSNYVDWITKTMNE